MSSQIVATEEILHSVGHGCHTAEKIAADLAVSASTVRRHAALLMERGWLTTQVTARQKGHRRVTSTAYILTASGQAAFDTNDAL